MGDALGMRSARPPGFYWMGTVLTGIPSYSWIVSDFGGFVRVYYTGLGTNRRVVCVP